jgi:hypothetical protein
MRVAEASRALRAARRESMERAGLSLRKLYKLTELPGRNSLKTTQDDLDEAVRRAYGMRANEDALSFLLDLNNEIASREGKGIAVQPPGPPSSVEDDLVKLISKDRMEAPQSGAIRFGASKRKKADQ